MSKDDIKSLERFPISATLNMVPMPAINCINTNSNLSEVKKAHSNTIFKKLNKAVLLSKNTRIKIGTKQNGIADI